MSSDKEKMYFKIYMDKESMDDHYVCPPTELPALLESIEEHLLEHDGLAPVIEPVLMTRKQFNELPEFQGF